jgi:STE24 endopeptidase
MAERPSLDSERQNRAKEFSRQGRRLALLEMALGTAYLLTWTVSGSGAVVADALEATLLGGWPLQLAAMIGSLAVPWLLVTLPLGYYGGFLLPHRLGQSNQTRSSWVLDQAKGFLIGILLGLPLLMGLYGMMRLWPETWWLSAGLGYTVFVAALSILAPVLLMPLFYKFRPLGEEHAELADRLTRLFAAAGRNVRGVFAFDMSRRTKSANAALVGLGRTRRIILGDTLLDHFPADEVESVLAHELGHDVHRDLPAGVLVESALVLGTLWIAQSALQASVGRGELSAPYDPAGFPRLALVFAAVGLLQRPLQNAYSRWRERRADEFAVRLTGRPKAFADALTRLANQNLADADPPRWAVLLFGSHPPLRERIRHAGETEAGPSLA